MARDLISNLSDWGLVYDEQDVRGRDAYSTDGSKLGEVRDMVADTDAEQIVASERSALLHVDARAA